MNRSGELLLHSASSLGHTVDLLFLSLLAISGLVALAVATLIVFFAVKYRRGSEADRSNPPMQVRWIEIAWTATPLAIFMGLFVWSSVVFSEFYRPPENSMRIHVLAKQWMWKVEHENGRREIDELHVPLGQPVELLMTSQDVIHSFFVPAFRVKQDVLPARYTSLWFTPTRVGRFNLFCAEYCGNDHATMRGSVVVMYPAEFAQWLAAGPDRATLAARGFDIYRRAGCSGCHEAGSTVRAPDLHGIYGRPVQLDDDRHVTADDTYLRDAILEPDKHVVAGYPAAMPSYQGQLDEDDLIALLAYMKAGTDIPQ